MPLFLSTYINKVDKKGRVSVPASFRAALSEQSVHGGFHGVVLFRSHGQKCLEGFAMERMEELSARLDQFDMFSSEQDDLATSIFGEARQLSFDGDGRVLLPTEFMDFAHIDDQAAFVGLGHKFQIWQPAAYEERKADARRNVQDRGLTLPKAPDGGAS